MNESTAAAADYADALITARKAKNILALIIFLMLCFQLGFFFLTRYKVSLDSQPRLFDFLKYVVGLIDFLGVTVPIVLAIILLLIVLIMLNGRLLGVSRIVSAFVWCIVLLVLLFPWQAFEFKIPGVLYTWTELTIGDRFHPVGFSQSLLYWSRFAGWPFIAIVITLGIQRQSRVGLRMALGNAALPPTIEEKV